jgi:hypothetical protein
MCCGRLRQTIASEPRPGNVVQSAATSAPRLLGGTVKSSPNWVGAGAVAEFEHNGASALTVVSPLTGKTYRFDGPGARVAVDPRDRSWVAFVPTLKAVGRP